MTKHGSVARNWRGYNAIPRSRFDRGDIYPTLAKSRFRPRVPARQSIDRTFTNDRELGRRIAQNRDHLREVMRARKTYVMPPAHPIIDRDIFLEIQRSLHCGHTVRLTQRSGGPVIRRRWPVRLNQWDLISKEDRRNRRKGLYEKLIWVPQWKHTGDQLKALSWAVVMEKQGGHAFTLHLTDQVIQSADRSRRGFAHYVQQRITAALRKEMKKMGVGVPDFFFAIEATLYAEKHVHGAIVIPDHPHSMEAVKKALRAAGGFSRAKLTGRELNMKAMHYAAGWAEYVTKWCLQSGEALGGTIYGATNSVRSAGRRWYEQARRDELPIYPDGGPDLIMQALAGPSI